MTSNVLLYKDGSYWFTKEIWGYYPGGANDHNLHLLGYEEVEKSDWVHLGIERDGFETPEEAYSYLAYVGGRNEG